MRVVYLDESEFNSPNQHIAYGSLVCNQPIESSVIQEALNNLQKDPDRLKIPAKKMDDRTLKRGYFHASDDSKNAHSHLCRSICKHVSGYFGRIIFDQTKMPSEEADTEYLKDLSAMLASIKPLNTDKPINIIFEQRHKLTIKYLNKLYNKLENNLLRSVYEYPFIPVYFPQVEVQTANKLEPGIQCVDFILWATNRDKNCEQDWLNRLIKGCKPFILANHETERINMGNLNFLLSNGIQEPICHYKIDDYPSVEEVKSCSNENLIQFFVHAVQSVEQCVKNLPEHIEFMQTKLEKVIAGKLDIGYKNYFEELATAYIKIFDTAPLIKQETPKSEKKFMLLSKKFIGLILRDDLIQGMRTKQYLVKIRKDIINKHPEKLKF